MRRFLAGIFVGACAAFLVLTVRFAATEGMASERTGAATSTQKNAPKILLENDRVRVREVTFAPGAGDAGMHTHDLPHVGVILTAGALVFTEPGKKAETVKFDVGSVGYREANVTHQVTNPGAAAMRVIEVELKPATGKR
jgi:quercetin dioxygenase-like cupin family protein